LDESANWDDGGLPNAGGRCSSALVLDAAGDTRAFRDEMLYLRSTTGSKSPEVRYQVGFPGLRRWYYSSMLVDVCAVQLTFIAGEDILEWLSSYST